MALAMAMALTLGVGGCSVPDTPFAAAARPDLNRRAPDGLLERPDLQRLVEAQYAENVEVLVTALGDDDPAVRARAAYALASVASPAAAPALRGRLDDPDARVRADVAFALGQLPAFGGAGAEAMLLDRLQQESASEVRDALIEALGRQGGTEASAALLAMTTEADQAEATLALARMMLDGRGAPATVDTLLRRLTDLDPSVRQHAAWYIGRSSDVRPWVERRAMVRNALARYRVDDPAGMHLLRGLGRYFDILSFPRILRAVHTSSDWRLRANALGSLAGLGNSGPRADAMFAGLADPAPLVRLRTVQLLPDEDPVLPFIEWAQDHLSQHPEERALAGPLLLYLSRVHRNDAVLEWGRTLPSDDAVGWSVLSPALVEFDGTLAGDLVAGGLQRGTEAVVEVLVGTLEQRWNFVSPFPFMLPEFDTWLSAAESSFALRAAAPDLNTEGGAALVRAGARLGALRRELERARTEGGREPEGSGAGPGSGVSSRSGAGAASDIGSEAAAPADSPAGEVGDPGDLDAGGAPRPDWALLRRLGRYPQLIIKIGGGRIVVQLDAEAAPLSVSRFAQLAGAGAFDGVAFHRVIPDFVAQTGAGIETPSEPLCTEVTRIPFTNGPRGRQRVFGVARETERHTETTQFFITHSMQPHLDGGYTSLGWVVEGQDVLDRVLPWQVIERAEIRPQPVSAAMGARRAPRNPR